ncbi:MAG: hypothetical protein Q4B10_03145 [Actinomycetaceae bacterium]|nr:hypothetical protein [Actinomycetaceae bacterium]
MAERLDDAAALLGLAHADITEVSVRERRDELLSYLASAPDSLAEDAKGKAERVRAAAETLLADLAAVSSEIETAEPATSFGVDASAGTQAALAELGEEDDDVYASSTVTTPSTRQRPEREAAVKDETVATNRSLRTSTLAVVVAIAAIAVVVLGVYALGRPNTPASPHPTAAASDQMERSASERAARLVEVRRAIEADPNNMDARLELGVLLFENEDLAGAKEQWERVVAAQPDNARVHFNLGFWYLSQDPSDKEGADREWDRVLELAPDSDMARIISMHRGGGMPTPDGGQ